MADGILNPIEQLEADLDFEVYTKQEVDALLDEKADKSDTYTKTETDALLNDKADADAVYTKTETDALLNGKADKSTTLAGYGITDAYTKTQTDNLLNGKADADSVYTKTEINTKIPNTVGSATKPIYVNGGILTECTHELNKTVPVNAIFTDTTYSAGNGLNLSGTSFSAKAGTNVTVDGNGINVNGSGVVASADSGLINGGTAYTELRPTLDGTWVKNAQTTATNLQKLEGGIEYLYGLLSHQYDQLKKYINGNYYDYDTDTNSAYTKTVLAGAMPYASLDSIGGKTLVWNQLVNPANIGASKTQNGITFTNNGDGSVTVSGTATGGNAGLSILSPRTWADHKFCLRGCPAGGSSSTYCLRLLGQGNNYFDTGDGVIWYHATARYKQCDIVVYEGTVISTPITFRPTFVDLTLMFGAGNEPTTVAEFQQTFPAVWYAYNPGSLLSAGVTEVVSKKADTTEIATYSIPAEIRSLEGYGWSAGSVFNYIDYEAKKFVKRVGKYTFTGSETWSDVPNAVFTLAITDALYNVYQYVVCDRYLGMVSGVGSSHTDTQKSCWLQSTSAYKRFYVCDSNYDRTTIGASMVGVEVYYPLATPVEIDISQYLTDDNLISVESGGTLTFPNSNGDDYRIAVPSQETYMVDLQEAL